MKSRPRHWRCFMASGLAAVFALLCTAPGFAQTVTNTFGGLSESSNEPIDVESDLLTIYPEQHATFSGNVKAIQGTTTIRARELKVNYLGGDKLSVGAANQGGGGEPPGGDDKSATDMGRVEELAPNGGGSVQPAIKKRDGGELATPTQASKGDSPRNEIKDPINIESDWLLVNDKEKFAQFRGNVKVKQGTTTLGARELKVSYAGGDNLSANARMTSGGGAGTQITKLEASGNVRALLTPKGSTDPKPPGRNLAETKAADTASQNTIPGAGNFDVANASNEASGLAQGTSGSGKSEPASPSNKAPGETSEGPRRNQTQEITKIEAKGDVVITGAKDETTSSDWLVYDLPLELVTIGGNVLLTQKENVLKGERLVVDLKTGETRFDNAGDGAVGGGRIRALFMPKGSKSGNDDKRDAAAEKLQRKAAPDQPAQGATVEGREPLQIVPEYR